MTKYCPNCRNNVMSEASFCPDCGSLLDVVNENEAATKNEAPAYHPAPDISQNKHQNSDLYPPVSTGLFFLLNLIMPIPVVGFILSFILTLAAKNKNLKNYSKAYLIGNLIIIIIAIIILILMLVFSALLGKTVFNF